MVVVVMIMSKEGKAFMVPNAGTKFFVLCVRQQQGQSYPLMAVPKKKKKKIEKNKSHVHIQIIHNTRAS